MPTHLLITGRVQGVGYRAWTVDEASRRGLTGWVRNRRDGTVEAVFAGEADAVQAMIAACRNGPPPARVSYVAVSDTGEEMVHEACGRFRALPTL